MSHGVSVIFDATANRSAYRQYAREHIPQFFEVYVDSPLQTCMDRDPKGIYRQARRAEAGTVPGLQVAYENPESPDTIFHGDRESAEDAAEQIIAQLNKKGYFHDAAQSPALER